jgi:hypothetical protein
MFVGVPTRGVTVGVPTVAVSDPAAKTDLPVKAMHAASINVLFLCRCAPRCGA